MLAIKNKVLEEVNLLPEDKLYEVYKIIHSFRLGFKNKDNKNMNIMNFAGIWKNMSENEFKDLSNEIKTRRKNAFNLRREFESGIN